MGCDHQGRPCILTYIDGYRWLLPVGPCFDFKVHLFALQPCPCEQMQYPWELNDTKSYKICDAGILDLIKSTVIKYNIIV